MIKAGMRFAAIAAALAGWAGSTALTAADAAPAVAHHPRVTAARPGGGGSSTGWASSNWSGYAVTGSTYTAITGSWTVPSVAASRKATYSSNWIGIDGFNDSNLIQTGTEQDYYNGSAHYYAWWEILPAAETAISTATITVHPGDVMTSNIHLVSGNSWLITIGDSTTGQSFSITQTYNGQLSSAEWIEEAPSVGGHTATLAHYSSPDTFDPGTVNGHNPNLVASDGGVMIQGRSQVSTPSNPDSDTDGFNMAYGSAAPSPPAS